eukprot:3559421-Pleurochrysis_carterae.AAC.1
MCAKCARGAHEIRARCARGAREVRARRVRDARERRSPYRSHVRAADSLFHLIASRLLSLLFFPPLSCRTCSISLPPFPCLGASRHQVSAGDLLSASL